MAVKKYMYYIIRESLWTLHDGITVVDHCFYDIFKSEVTIIPNVKNSIPLTIHYFDNFDELFEFFKEEPIEPEFYELYSISEYKDKHKNFMLSEDELKIIFDFWSSHKDLL
jgi:hypothetical protein